jgi:hypothetical protein
VDGITSYYQEMQTLSDVYLILENSEKDNSEYPKCIGDLKRDLHTANGTIWLLQKLATNTPTLQTMELPYPAKYFGDQKELPNLISKVCAKLTRENTRFTDYQYELHYLDRYLKGNA